MELAYFLDTRVATPHFPGIGRYTRNLHSALLPLLSDEEILTAIGTTGSTVNSEQANFQLVTVDSDNFSLRQQWEIPRLLRREGATLYHSPYYLMPYRNGVPTVLTVYDFIGLHYPEYFSARARLLFRFTHGLAVKSADALISISNATQRDLIHFHNPQKPLHVTPLAPAPRFQPTDPTTVRAKFDLPESYLLYFGSNKPHKNITTLIEAIAQLPDAPPLIIAGAWLPEHPEPKMAVERLNLAERVRFLGRVKNDDLAGLYSGATLFVFPSLFEGFGLPVIEAMACGVAVACGNTSSLPEVGGDAVAYFDAKSADSIAHTINHLLTHPDERHDLAQRGLQRSAQFSWKHTAAQTLAVYRSLVA